MKNQLLTIKSGIPEPSDSGATRGSHQRHVFASLMRKSIVLAPDRVHHLAPYPGGATKPPASLDSRSAKLIGVASSHIGPVTWIPTGSPSLLRPTGATVAGQPVSVAGEIQLSKSI